MRLSFHHWIGNAKKDSSRNSRLEMTMTYNYCIVMQSEAKHLSSPKGNTKKDSSQNSWLGMTMTYDYCIVMQSEAKHLSSPNEEIQERFLAEQQARNDDDV